MAAGVSPFRLYREFESLLDELGARVLHAGRGGATGTAKRRTCTGGTGVTASRRARRYARDVSHSVAVERVRHGD